MRRVRFSQCANYPKSITPTTHVLNVIGRGEEREAVWNEGGGLLVAGHDLGIGEIVEIYGESHTIVELRRVLIRGTPFSLIRRTAAP